MDLPYEIKLKILNYLSTPTSVLIKNAYRNYKISLNYVLIIYRINSSGKKLFNDLDPNIINSLYYADGKILRKNLPLSYKLTL
jgi:hypothetical protein